MKYHLPGQRLQSNLSFTPYCNKILYINILRSPTCSSSQAKSHHINTTFSLLDRVATTTSLEHRYQSWSTYFHRSTTILKEWDIWKVLDRLYLKDQQAKKSVHVAPIRLNFSNIIVGSEKAESKQGWKPSKHYFQHLGTENLLQVIILTSILLHLSSDTHRHD